jgi:predicted ATPase
VTFLFTDIEGSTRLWESAPDAMRDALARHDVILRTAIQDHDGYVFASGGDGFAIAFRRAGDALAAASVAQAALRREQWPTGVTVAVRMALHSGEAEERGGNYFGPALNRAARLMAIGHGGQVLCSQATAALAGPNAGLRNLGEHRLRDLGAAEVVFQVGDGAFPPLRSVDLVPTNLPTVRTELIGRSDDIAAVGTLVERERLVTLTGVGGVGKTRLALGVAAAASHGFGDGCWLVELAPVADGAEVVKTVAAAIGTPLTDLESLVTYLADRRMLIVLDNCEHLVADSADFVDAVVEVAPEVRVVATSREPLGVDGERVYRVDSLELPSSGAQSDDAGTAAAVLLFADRASAVSRGFAIEPGNVEAVADICRHLDGIPLAIELAAARVRAMPPAEIAGRLSERFRILSGGSRRAQERHRTLLATVSWSHDLLSEDEKAVFRRLAVFPASFDLAAAEAVAGTTERIDVLETVVRLVDRSLVQYEPEVGRYRLLETLRQYGADRMSEAGETDAARRLHAEYFLQLAQRTAPELQDARYTIAQTMLLSELENLRAAADWCIDGERWKELWDLARPLWIFLFQAAPLDGASWYSELIDHADSLDPQVVVDALAGMAFLAVQSFAEYEDGLALAERSITRAKEADLELSPWAWLARTQAALFTQPYGGDPDRDALAAVDLGLAAADARNDELAAVIALGVKANWLAELGDADGSSRTSTEALRRARRSGHPINMQMAVVTASSSYVFRTPGRDFEASLRILAGYDETSRIDAAIAMWLDVQWGIALVGLHKSGAVSRLARAVRAADRQRARNAEDLALRLFAIAIAQADAALAAQADMLTGYANAHLRVHRIDSPAHFWIHEFLDTALADTPDRASRQAAGARLTRHEMLAIVNDTEATLADT